MAITVIQKHFGEGFGINPELSKAWFRGAQPL
jgi:hypothetical protein